MEDKNKQINESNESVDLQVSKENIKDLNIDKNEELNLKQGTNNVFSEEFLNEVSSLIDRYNKMRSEIDSKTKKDTHKESKKDNIEVVFKDLKKELDELKEKINFLVGGDKREQESNLKDSVSKENLVSGEKVQVDEYRKLVEELNNVKSELEALKKERDAELSKKLSELEKFKEKIMKDKTESLYLKRQELIERYGLEELSDFIPNPLDNPNLTEKELYASIENLLKNDIIRSGVELKKKNDVIKNKSGQKDIRSLSKDELIKLRNSLLHQMQ